MAIVQPSSADARGADPSPAAPVDARGLLPALIAGLVGGLLALSASISYPAVIFTGAFEAHLGVGIGMALFSSAVLAAIVAAGSTYPAAIANSQIETAVVLGAVAAEIAGIPGHANCGPGGARDPARGDPHRHGDARHRVRGVRRLPARQRDPLHPLPGHRRLPGLHRLAAAARRHEHYDRAAPHPREQPPALAAGHAALLAARSACRSRAAGAAADPQAFLERTGRVRRLRGCVLARGLARGRVHDGIARQRVPSPRVRSGADLVAARSARRTWRGRLGARLAPAAADRDRVPSWR